jgi:hypothetical protein
MQERCTPRFSVAVREFPYDVAAYLPSRNRGVVAGAWEELETGDRVGAASTAGDDYGVCCWVVTPADEPAESGCRSITNPVKITHVAPQAAHR